MPTITSTKELKAALRMGAYAWPGGYPIYFICTDGEALSYTTVKKEFRLVLESMRYNLFKRPLNGDWNIIGYEVNYEDNDLYDAHTGEKIEVAYSNNVDQVN